MRAPVLGSSTTMAPFCPESSFWASFCTAGTRVSLTVAPLGLRPRILSTQFCTPRSVAWPVSTSLSCASMPLRPYRTLSYPMSCGAMVPLG